MTGFALSPNSSVLMSHVLFSTHCDKVTVLALFILRTLVVGRLHTWTNMKTVANTTDLQCTELCDTFTNASMGIFKIVSVHHNSKYSIIQHPKLFVIFDGHLKQWNHKYDLYGGSSMISISPSIIYFLLTYWDPVPNSIPRLQITLSTYCSTCFPHKQIHSI